MSDSKEGGSSSVSPSHKTPLPPPPTFDPSTLPVFNTESKVSLVSTGSGFKSGLTSKNSSGISSSSASSLVQNLPKPPPLPIKKSSSSLNTSVSSEHSSGIPPFESDKGKRSVVKKNENYNRATEESEHVHQTVEEIPKLESAPPSGPGSTSSSTSTSEHIVELQRKEDANEKPHMDDAFSARSWLPSRPISPTITKTNSPFSKASSEDEQKQTPSVKVVQQKNKNTVHPKYHILSYSQRSIPILIQATPSAEAVATKNNLTLSELMNGLANSIPSQSSSLTGKLAPIRSISRMINFSWDMIHFNFYNESDRGIRTSALNDIDSGKDPQWENRFNYVAKPWPEDNDKTLMALEEEMEMHLLSNEKDGKTASSQNASFSDSNTSWLARFLNGVQQQTDQAQHSMIHCPIVVLYIATTSDGVKGLLNLTEKRRLPQEFQNGLFDPNGFKAQYLMLHDEVDGPKDWNEASVSEDLMRVFGNDTVSLIRMNSQSEGGNGMLKSESIGNDSDGQEEDLVWDEYIPFSMPLGDAYRSELRKLRGTYLSEKDKLAIRRFVSRMVAKAVIPTLERRIHNLNIEVTNNKKGVKNAFKSFWRKPRDSDSLSQSVHGRDQLNSSSTVPYRYDTIESHTRLLADTLFLIRDYDSALSIYRLVKDDYKHDQQLMLSASVHEMMALCIYYTDLSTGYRNTKDIIQHIDSALYLYTSAAAEVKSNTLGSRPSEASLPTRCVTRLGLLLSTMKVLNQGREMETADSLAAASSKETPLTGAVLLEQSAAYYFQAGMVRKYAFHMLMAGHMFRSAGQDFHAVRCFASSMYVLGFLFSFITRILSICSDTFGNIFPLSRYIYHSGNRCWNELFNHLTSALAGQLYIMKRMQLSMQLYMKLLGTLCGGKVSVRSQQKFLDHLMTICRGYEKEAMQTIDRMKLFYDGNENYERLQEVNDVLKSTPGTSRILEVHHMNLPKIFDHTVLITNSSTVPFSNTPSSGDTIFGVSTVGSETIWEQLRCYSEAELKVSSHVSSDISVPKWTQSVIEAIEEEQKQSRIQARMRKKSNDPKPPEIRAKLDPITVSFTMSNPLNVLIPVTSIQLVARITCSKTHRVYTNLEAIEFTIPTESMGKMNKKWKFSGSEGFFEIPQFARISPSTDAETEAWHSGTENGIDPFFLVSTSRIAMDPTSDVCVSLEICPLVTGDLEILGVRCKIFNEIWVYSQFKIKGPLLHNNTSNRRNKVRAPSNLLRSKIDCPMPNLSFDIIQSKSSTTNSVLLQGQRTRWDLQISNNGAAPATNLILKTNLPWINVLLEEGIIVDEKSSVSNCIGPSGTLMRLPLHIYGNSIGKVGILNPGKTINIPIEIRTVGAGKQDFYMLLRYELYEKMASSKQSTSRHRWLRKMISVPVYPSLTFTASITPSFKDKNEYILSLDMSNFRGDRESDLDISVERVCVASKNYLIKPFIIEHSASNLPEDPNELSGYRIGWQEQVTMHYIITPTDSNAHLCFLSDVGDLSNDELYVDKSLTDFICLEHANAEFSEAMQKYREEKARIEAENKQQGDHPRSIAQIRRANTSSLSEETDYYSSHPLTDQILCHPSSRAALCSSQHSDSEINLICSWKTKGDRQGDIVVGQHHLRHLAVRPQHKTRSCPLTITASFNPSIAHNFETGPLRLQMEISIRNRLARSTVDFNFHLEGTSDFDFIGFSCFRKTLTGGDDLSLPIEALIFRPGLFNLQSVKVTIYHPDGHETPYVFPMQWIIQINCQ